MLNRHVPAKALSGRSHVGIPQIVVFSVGSARHQVLRRALAGTLPRHQVGRIMQVPLAQKIAKGEEVENAQEAAAICAKRYSGSA